MLIIVDYFGLFLVKITCNLKKNVIFFGASSFWPSVAQIDKVKESCQRVEWSSWVARLDQQLPKLKGKDEKPSGNLCLGNMQNVRCFHSLWGDLRPDVIINVVVTFQEMISFNPHIKRRPKCIHHLVNNAIHIPVVFCFFFPDDEIN